MMYDPIKKQPIKIDGKIVRFKTGDDAFVKGDGSNPTADEIIRILKERYKIEYDPLKMNNTNIASGGVDTSGY